MDMKSIFKAYIIFMMGFAGMYLISEIIPTIIEIGEGLLPNSDISETIFFFLAIIYFVLGIILPSYSVYKGLNTESDTPKIAYIFMGIIFCLIFLALTIKGWYIIDVLNSLITDGMFYAVFWAGVIILWIESVIIIPAYMIIKGLSPN